MRTAKTLSGIFLFQLLLLGCAKAFLIPEPRSRYQVQKVEDLYVTNLDLFLDDMWDAKSKGSVTQLQYKFTIQNISDSKNYQIKPEAKLIAGGASSTVQCKSQNENKELVLSPKMTLSVLCNGSILHKDFPALSKSDQIASLNIYYSADKGKDGQITFPYKLKIEDVNEK